MAAGLFSSAGLCCDRRHSKWLFANDQQHARTGRRLWTPTAHPAYCPSACTPAPPLPLPAAVVRAAAERGAGHAGLGAAAFVAPLLLNLALSLGDNEEVCYCLKVGGCAWAH